MSSAAKTAKGTLTVHVRVQVKGIELKPEAEAYPDDKTVMDCLRSELKWCDGKDGQGDYLLTLMDLGEAVTFVDKVKFKQKNKKPMIVRNQE